MTSPGPEPNTGRLTPLPPSPSSSHSSLTSEETSFDHRAPFVSSPPTPRLTSSAPKSKTADADEAKAQTLGLRDLVNMRRTEKARAKALAPPAFSSLPTTLPLPTSSAGARGEILLHSPVSESTEGAGAQPPDYFAPPLSPVSPTDGPFASQVTIRGWKVVGGKSWTDGGKVGAYVVYDIDIALRNGGNISILRRYTDFVRLRTTLKSRFTTLGQAIPPLPSKNHMSKFNPKFLDERQPRLQRFLRGVILHPEMGKGGEGSVVGMWVTGPGG